MDACTVRMVLMGSVLACGFLCSTVQSAAGQDNKPDDPTGILRKKIPDKLVVLTFDDGPVSGYTVVAPILKSLGLNCSFYPCDFASFKTRKDWYMTWRQNRRHRLPRGAGQGASQRFPGSRTPDKDPNCFISFSDVISGPGALVLNSSGAPNVAEI